MRRLLAAHTSEEIAEWEAYHAIEPFGEERADFRAGVIAAAIWNTSRYRKNKHDRKDLWEPEDFMHFGPNARNLTARQTQAALRDRTKPVDIPPPTKALEGREHLLDAGLAAAIERAEARRVGNGGAS